MQVELNFSWLNDWKLLRWMLAWSGNWMWCFLNLRRLMIAIQPSRICYCAFVFHICTPVWGMNMTTWDESLRTCSSSIREYNLGSRICRLREWTYIPQTSPLCLLINQFGGQSQLFKQNYSYGSRSVTGMVTCQDLGRVKEIHVWQYKCYS
jgi:hypothetical protein